MAQQQVTGKPPEAQPARHLESEAGRGEGPKPLRPGWNVWPIFPAKQNSAVDAQCQAEGPAVALNQPPAGALQSVL